VRALVLKGPGEAAIETVPHLIRNPDHVLLRVRTVGLCGTDPNSFRGKNPLIPAKESVTETVALDDVPEMLRRWSDHPAAFNKIMVRID
jgi:threonine dehydrogenase-like Zn-dependent dehydrogenase